MDDLLELFLEVICHALGVEEKIQQKPKIVRVLLYILLLAIIILSSLLVNALIMLWRDPTKSDYSAFWFLGALFASALLFVFLLRKKFKRK